LILSEAIMALTKQKKQDSIESIKKSLTNQKSIIFADFSKVNSADLFDLRKKLKEAGCALKIGKKTLIRVAFGQSGISFWNKIKSSIPGQLALVFGIDDEIAPARISNQFAKKNENFKILGGIFPAEGGSASGGEVKFRFIDREKALVLANLPSRNELLGRLVGSLSSPITSFVRVIDQIKQTKI